MQPCPNVNVCVDVSDALAPRGEGLEGAIKFIGLEGKLMEYCMRTVLQLCCTNAQITMFKFVMCDRKVSKINSDCY